MGKKITMTLPEDDKELIDEIVTKIVMDWGTAWNPRKIDNRTVEVEMPDDAKTFVMQVEQNLRAITSRVHYERFKRFEEKITYDVK